MSSKNHNIKASNEEIVFLQGPRSRIREFFFLMKAMIDFIRGFRKLHFVGPCVTVFGSARFDENHVYYQQARLLGALIAKSGFTVMTGGGPGIMEAANRGAFEVGGKSVGCNIVLPKEQEPNPYLHKWVSIRQFFVRKVLLSKYSYAFVVMPGGLGTMDEMFEALTLIQTGKIEQFPVVLMGKEYYKELEHLLDVMVDQRTIDKKDLDLFLFTDSEEEAIKHINRVVTKFNLTAAKRIKPVKLLGETN